MLRRYRLHYNFVEAASSGASFDMRKIFDGSLVQYRPQDAVTLVNNHERANSFACPLGLV